jgi:glutaminyl-tRNA synthetase
MNMNFQLAFEKLGVEASRRQTVFRYDDTNPEAESSEYIQSLAEDVAWLGWRPSPTTFTSDYFAQLYELAVTLIKKGKAYVCHQSKVEIEACREVAKAKTADPSAVGDPCSPWRDRPIADSLRLFEDMRKGKFDANAATLRLKMDMASPNPNMWDQVAYRIKYIPHPHVGAVWCIYPTYDYTHCIIDSLEHIDYRCIRKLITVTTRVCSMIKSLLLS